MRISVSNATTTEADVGWGVPVERFVWAAVEFGGDGGEVVGAVDGQVGAFWCSWV